MSASFIDSKAAIAERLPWALGLIALSTFILLFLMFGSVLVPLKAIVLNILSLSATFGAMVWVFQWGHGAGFLDFTATGLTELSTPILIFCVAFGLSMDYEVFLLSRISEEYKKSGDNTESVVMDATVVRATLVPAFMQLAGNANWWAPAWMKAIHERFGLSESEPELLDIEITAIESTAPDATRDDELSSV